MGIGQHLKMPGAVDGAEVAKKHVVAEPARVVQGTAPKVVSGDTEGLHAFIMPEEHKQILNQIFDKVAAISGSTSKASWAAVRCMDIAAKSDSEYTEVIVKAKYVPAGLPMPFGMDDMNIELAYTKSQDDRNIKRRMQELERSDFLNRITIYAQGEHQSSTDGCNVLGDIVNKYNLLLKYAPLTDKEEDRIMAIFHATDADQDKELVIGELDLLANFSGSPFTQKLLQTESRSRMTFPGFAAYMSHVKVSQPDAWAKGMLNQIEQQIKNNTEASQRFEKSGNSYFEEKWLVRDGGWRLRFDGYEDKVVAEPDVNTTNNTQTKGQDDTLRSNMSSDQPRKEACSCEACVIC